MSYLEQSRQNKANAQKAQAFDAQQTKQRAQQVYEAGKGEGADFGYRQGLQEGAQQVAGFKQRLMDLFGQRPPEQGLAATVVNPAGQAARRDMENAARQEAFAEADAMGDRSEETMNILMNRAFERRGL